MNNFICSVIVTYNPEIDVLDRQLQSMYNQVDEIIIVDNNSENKKEIREKISSFNIKNNCNFYLIQNQDNLGLGKAQNDGINFAASLAASHIILFDQDSILDSGFVSGLLKSENILKAEGKKVGAVGPIYYNELTAEVYPISKYNGPFIERIVPVEKPAEASFLIASGCLISLDVFKKVGYMNEDLFIDYIDVEWSFRAKSYGYSVFASPFAKMKHTIGDDRTSILGRSISIHSPLRRYYLYRNSIFMVKDPNIFVGYKIREIFFNTFRFLIFLVIAKERMKYFKYSISGFWDGFKGVKGKCPHVYN